MSGNTTLLGLNQPTTGGDSGIWGDEVNNGFTALVDISVAGTNNLTTDGDITLAVSNGTNTSTFASTGTNSTVAQYYVLNCSGARTAARNIIVPTSSKTYVVINNTTGGYAITVKKSGGTGVSIANGETAIVYYNSTTSDVVKVTTFGTVLPVSSGGTGVATLTGIVKGNGTSAMTAAVSGTDYAPATSGTSILYGNGSGGFSNVTVSTGLNFSGGVLTATGGAGTVTSVSGTGTVNGLTLSGTVTTTGSLTLSGAVTSLTTANFTVQQSGGKLIIQYGGTTLFSIDSSGNMTTIANVTAYGTP